MLLKLALNIIFVRLLFKILNFTLESLEHKKYSKNIVYFVLNSAHNKNLIDNLA